MNPFISIIMPVYNSGSYLDICIKSILGQSFSDFELILVDDGSTDGSSERCDYWSEMDNRIVVLHQQNAGICVARNNALKIAKGKYIGFSDHDDEYGENQLSDNVALLEENNGDIVIFGYNSVYSNESEIIKKDYVRFETCTYTTDSLKNSFWSLFRRGAFDCVWCCLFRKTFLLENDIWFDPYYRFGGEDYDFLWNCVGHLPVLCTNKGLYYNHYIRNGFSTSTKYNPNIVDVAFTRSERLVPLIEKYIDVDFKSSDYFSFWIQRVLGDLCNYLSRPKCPLNPSERVSYLTNLKESKYLCTVSWGNTNVKWQYILLFILFKFNMYGSCIGLYKLLNKIRGIK